VHTRFWWEELRERTPLGIPTCRWDDNIKIDLHVGWGGMDWTGLAVG